MNDMNHIVRRINHICITMYVSNIEKKRAVLQRRILL